LGTLINVPTRLSLAPQLAGAPGFARVSTNKKRELDCSSSYSQRMR